MSSFGTCLVTKFRLLSCAILLSDMLRSIRYRSNLHDPSIRSASPRGIADPKHNCGRATSACSRPIAYRFWSQYRALRCMYCLATGVRHQGGLYKEWQYCTVRGLSSAKLSSFVCDAGCAGTVCPHRTGLGFHTPLSLPSVASIHSGPW
jgi:hypothetical protein